MILVLAYLSEFFLLLILIPLVLQVAAPFVDTPMGKRSGKLTYYSPLFIAEKPRNGEVVIHGGTLFDYLFTLDPKMSGKERTRSVLIGYLQGLIRFISNYEEEERNTDFKVKGTSYVINERTARRAGFQPVQTDFVQLQRLILLVNYIPLILSASYSKKRIDFPRISGIKTYEADINDLIDQKNNLILMKKRLEKMI